MKKIAFLSFFASFFLVLNAQTSEEDCPMLQVQIYPVKSKAQVDLSIYIDDVSGIRNIELLRASDLDFAFRKISTFKPSELKVDEESGAYLAVDSYPIPGSTKEVYYRIKVEDECGIIRYYRANLLEVAKVE